ncbi:MAG: protein kinase, partial [Planctomycetota bacterium]
MMEEDPFSHRERAEDSARFPTDPQIDPLLRAAFGDEEPPSKELSAEEVPRVENYRIIRELGRGGMGVVYEAVQEHPERTVALKVLGSSLHSHEMRRRFEREAATLARLVHPAIAQVYDAG